MGEKGKKKKINKKKKRRAYSKGRMLARVDFLFFFKMPPAFDNVLSTLS
jgi:hypothetical protein